METIVQRLRRAYATGDTSFGFWRRLAALPAPKPDPVPLPLWMLPKKWRASIKLMSVR